MVRSLLCTIIHCCSSCLSQVSSSLEVTSYAEAEMWRQ